MDQRLTPEAVENVCLRAQVDVLKRMLLDRGVKAFPAASVGLGQLTDDERSILAALLRRYPEPVEAEDLRSVRLKASGRSPGQYVLAIRQKLGSDAIETVHGYRPGRGLIDPVP